MIDMVTREVPAEGWSVFAEGELVFSVDTGKWDTIGPAIAKIMDDQAGAVPAEIPNTDTLTRPQLRQLLAQVYGQLHAAIMRGEPE